ncbi:MAG: FAD-dependent monooxygenase [Gemmatimonadales bacterium]
MSWWWVPVPPGWRRPPCCSAAAWHRWWWTACPRARTRAARRSFTPTRSRSWNGSGSPSGSPPAGHQLSQFSIRDRDRVLTQLSFAHLPSRYPYLLMLPQDRTEAMLTEALTEAGGAVHRSHTVQSLEQGADGVRVQLET